MKRRTDVETSSPSFYFEMRQQPEIVAPRAFTPALVTPLELLGDNDDEE
jgi:hypothetical protein